MKLDLARCAFQLRAALPGLDALQTLMDRAATHQSSETQTPKKENIPKFSTMSTDKLSIDKYLKRLDAIPLEVCKEAAMAGSADGAYCLATRPNNPEALAKAVELGHLLAIGQYAHVLYNAAELGKTKLDANKRKNLLADAKSFLFIAALNGIPHCQVDIGWYHMTGERGFQVAYDEAFAWNLQGYRLGHSEGANNIGELYEKGLGVPKDVELAASWYKKASELGNKEAAQSLVRLGK